LFDSKCANLDSGRLRESFIENVLLIVSKLYVLYIIGIVQNISTFLSLAACARCASLTFVHQGGHFWKRGKHWLEVFEKSGNFIPEKNEW